MYRPVFTKHAIQNTQILGDDTQKKPLCPSDVPCPVDVPVENSTFGLCFKPCYLLSSLIFLSSLEPAYRTIEHINHGRIKNKVRQLDTVRRLDTRGIKQVPYNEKKLLLSNHDEWKNA